MAVVHPGTDGRRIGSTGSAPAVSPSPQTHSASWRRTAGLTFLGQAQGSGLREPVYLVRRGDGQMVQLSDLLHDVLLEVEASRSVDEIADATSERQGRRLTSEGLVMVLESRLEPIGLVEDATHPSIEPPPVANPLLSLTMRGVLIPERVVRVLARTFAPLYLPPIVVAVVAALVALDVSLLLQGDLLAALTQLLATPTLVLVLFGLTALGGIVHEIGHAAACHYGGGRPGSIGFGVYVVFPAFYTDVTDSYRLSRGGRLRTDLGGLYFNVWCLLLAGGAYLATGHGLFLLLILMMQVQMLQQLVPALRFDGYYILADLAGVPDLFARVGPVLHSLPKGRPSDPRVAELRPAARRIVVAWVLIVVPLLLAGFGWLIWALPTIVEETILAIGVQADQIVAAWESNGIPLLLLSVLSIVLLVLPLMGVVVVSWRLGGMLLAFVRGLLGRRMGSATEGADAMLMKPRSELTAAAFDDATMLPQRRPVPKSGWQRALYVGTGHVLNVGPGPTERARDELADRLRTPIEGSRRVVVMSRKGGVGKTTMTFALGSTFSSLRGDRVVAVDANPDAGNLAYRVAAPSKLTITDLLRDLGRIESYAQLRKYTTQAPESRLEVLGSDDDPRIGMALDREAYHRLITVLDRFYNLILLDTGTGILDSANQGLLSETDELVLVLRPGIDGGRAAALTLDWLEEHAYGELVSRAVVVINAVRRGVGAPLDPIVDHFEKRCSRVVTVPWDPALETGGQTEMAALRPDTYDALIQVAAAVADNFAESEAKS
jgi:putative peptide zinc metalloprotease protein